MSVTPRSVVIVGAGHAGVTLAVALRQSGFAGELTLVTDEPHLPYQRPPLSKGYLTGKITDADLAFRPRDFYPAQKIGLRYDPAVSIDRQRRQLELRSGVVLAYEHLVLATGSASRLPPLPGFAQERFVSLRTLDDARALRSRLAVARRIVTIGGGFIGLELAAAAAGANASFDLVELDQRLVARAVSHPISGYLAEIHAGWGARLHLGEATDRIEADGALLSVATTAGRILPADLLVAAIGARPNTELAERAGLVIDNGISVDQFLRTADPDISAIGDCASFPSGGRRIRLESVQNAADQARAVADRLVGKPKPYARVPWFWTDQRDIKLQIAGFSARGFDDFRVIGDRQRGAFSVLRFLERRLVAVDSVNSPADHMLARRLLAAEAPLTLDDDHRREFRHAS